MKEAGRFAIIFTIAFAVYFLPELLFAEAMLYIVGGITGGLLQQLLKAFVEKPEDNLVLLLWGIILLGFIGLFFAAKRRCLKYFVALIVALLLYIIDFVFLGSPVAVVALKSFILSIILCLGFDMQKRSIQHS